jgi:hypothetical protein
MDNLEPNPEGLDPLDPSVPSAPADRTAELEAQLAAVTRERDEALAALEKAEKSADRAKARAAAATAGETSATLRKIGPDVRGLEEIEPDEMLEAIRKADKVEVVFSDGERELALPPATISGEAWRKTPGGLMLDVPELLVHGPGTGQRGFSLAGYGLMLDGKLAAYAPRAAGELSIGQGVTYDLKDDVVF